MNQDYARKFLETGGFIWGDHSSKIPLVSKIKELRNMPQLVKQSTISIDQLKSSTVISGQNDAFVSPPSSFSNVVIPNKGHFFPDFVPLVVQKLSALNE
jgi:hypothetical protein